jgi:hypothetical protein
MLRGIRFASPRYIAASTALALGLLAQTALAADPETITSAGATAASVEQSASVSAPIQRNAENQPMRCGPQAECIVGHTSEGWLLDTGGPGLRFEATHDD